MARPRKPLISRQKTLEIALRLIDTEGLEALTMRRLGQELNVRGVSLYHHFRDKDAILLGVCSLAFEKVRRPDSADHDWREWLNTSTLALYDILCEHPNLIPLVTGRYPIRFGLADRNMTAGVLRLQGVEGSMVLPLMEALEALALGAAGYQSAMQNAELSEDVKNEYPFLYMLNSERGRSKREMVALMTAATIATVAEEQKSRASDRAAAAPT